MGEDPNREVPAWEMRDHMRTHNNFRLETETRFSDLDKLSDKLDCLAREQRRTSLALFAPDDKNEFNMVGVLHTVREGTVAWSLVRKSLPWLWAALGSLLALMLFLLGVVMRVMYQLITKGVINIS